MGLRSAHLPSMLKLLHSMSSFEGRDLFKKEKKERGGGEAGEEKESLLTATWLSWYIGALATQARQPEVGW